MSAAVVTHNRILVGFKPIDDLHSEFESILEALNDPAEADYGAHCSRCTNTCCVTATPKSPFMLQENYSHYARHKRAHEHLLDSVSEVRRQFDAGDVDAVHRYSVRPDELVCDPRVVRGCRTRAFLRGAGR